MKKVILFTGLFLLAGCSASFSDVHADLGNGYFYLGEGPTQSYIYYSKNLMAPSIDSIIVWPTVMAYAKNDTYIIALQTPNESISRQNLVYINDKTEISADSILITDSFFINMLAHDTCYWIIQKNEFSTFGPLSRDAFRSIKDSLNIDLTLNNNHF